VGSPLLRYPQRGSFMPSNWGFVLAAYGFAAGVLLGYWWRVERGVRALESRGRRS
jgi:hypothetical protein